MNYIQLKTSIAISLLVFCLNAGAQNQLKTPFFNEAQWYFNPAASGAQGKLNASIIYSYEPSVFRGNEYTMSRAVVGIDGKLSLFKKSKQLNLTYGVTSNLLAPNGTGTDNFFQSRITDEKYKEFGFSLANQFELKNGHKLSVGAFYRWSKYTDTYKVGRYEQVNKIGEPPAYDVKFTPTERRLRINTVGFGTYFENKDRTIFAGISADNSPQNIWYSYQANEGIPEQNYSANLWNLRMFYSMKIKLGRLLTLEPSVSYQINDKYNSVDLSARLYLKDKYYLGVVQQDNGNAYSAVAGVKLKRFEIGASLGQSFIGSSNKSPITANLFLNYKFLQKKK